MEMKPGIYRGMSFTDYLAIDAVSSSIIRAAINFDGSISMEAMRDAMDNPIERTDSMRLGSFFHCAQLEPLAMMQRYVVMPPFHLDAANATKKGEATESKVTSYYKAKRDAFIEVNASREVVEQIDFDRTMKMLESMARRDTLRKWWSVPGDVEVVVVWNDAETGVLLKARIDKAIPSYGVMSDLKSTSDLASFPTSIRRYRYDVQQIIYEDGYATAAGWRLKPYLVACESDRPYRCAWAGFDDEQTDTARRLYRDILKFYAMAQRTGNWLDNGDKGTWEPMGTHDRDASLGPSPRVRI